MNALVIYDNTGKIWSIVYGVETAPQGLQAMYVDIPDGAVLDYIDTTEPSNPKPVFSYLPESDIGRLQTDMKQIQENVEHIREKSVYAENALRIIVKDFSDEDALTVKELHPDWNYLPEGTHLEAGQRILYNDHLYKVRDSHNKQASWTPTDALTLYTAIDEMHIGTPEDPIPAVENMEYYEGKYYSEGDTVYFCTRSTGIPIAQMPSMLIGIYFSAE